MSGKAEYITNFWSHFPNGLTFGELTAISPEASAAYQAAPAIAPAVVAGEATLMLIPEQPTSAEQIVAA